jgi:hypothetical protein
MPLNGRKGMPTGAIERHVIGDICRYGLLFEIPNTYLLTIMSSRLVILSVSGDNCHLYKEMASVAVNN